MEQNYSNTQLPTTASQVTSSFGASWVNPSNITADDGSSSTLGYFAGGDNGAAITGADFDFPPLPDSAIIDGIGVFIDGSQTGCYGTVSLNLPDTTTKSMGAFGGYGGNTDLWGADEIDVADIPGIEVTVDTGDVSGGDGIAAIDYVSITIFWHIEVTAPPADVPTRVAYKMFSRDRNYLGELPNVNSPFAFSQEKNSAGSSITVVCGKNIDDGVSTSPLLTEDDDEILTEDDLVILSTEAAPVVALGSSPDEVLFKNSNRLQVWLYNNWYPNGKLMFSGQVKRVSFPRGEGKGTVKLTVYSDGVDMDGLIARGYPFSYTDDQVQTAQNAWVYVTQSGGSWNRYGQTFKTGSGVTNVGAIPLLLNWSGTVTVSLYDAPNGNLLGSTTQNVSLGVPTVVQFEFPQLIAVTALTTYFFTVSVADGQTVVLHYNNSSVYADGTAYNSSYSGGSGGGTYGTITGDLYFKTRSGTPTTTTVFTSDDPVTDMMSSILLDYNARGGYITERNFVATGLSLTYPFNSATIYDALKKILELSPAGYYSYIDLGTAEMDIQPISTTADFTIVLGKDIKQLDIDLSIEQVKNYLLLSGGEVSPGVNLFREYKDTESSAFYGTTTAAKSDNRLTLDATADAIGESFIEENSDETQETRVVVLNHMIDITLLTPGKTIGFRNAGGFVDDMILQVVRRDYMPHAATLTLGRLPVTMSAEVQRINRELMLEQTVNNPSQPS